jgi:hypothetical protein
MLGQLFALLIFPAGLFVLVNGLVYHWVDRKLVARLQNRVGPRWFQPAADLVKLLANEEVIPYGRGCPPVRGAAGGGPGRGADRHAVPAHRRAAAPATASPAT